MTSVLIVDSDPIALELLQRAFQERDSVTCVALHAEQAAEKLADACCACDGLITTIALGRAETGWDIARMARAANPAIAIGYMSAEVHRDWVSSGVPNSVLISTALDEVEIAGAFLRYCASGRRESNHIGRVTEAIALAGREPRAPGAPPQQAADRFWAADWAATPLGAAETWDNNLRSWVHFMLVSGESLLMLWGPERISTFNTPFQAAFGTAFDQALGAPFAPPQSGDWDQCAALLDQGLGGQSGARESLLLSTVQGAVVEERFFNLSCGAIQDHAGATVGAICLFTDTTDATRIAVRVRKERDALLALLDQTPGFIAVLEGSEHRFTFTNPAFLQLVERSGVLGERVVDAFSEVIAQGFVAILDRVYRTGEPFVAKGVSMAFLRNDGSLKETVLDLNYDPIGGPNGAITGILVSGEDTTEHHRAQARIGALQNELIHISRINAMGMMVSTIAHELNQPLTTIHNYMTVAKVVIERGGDDPVAIESLRGAADAALRAGEIIRNLRAMTTRREVVRAPVLLEQALREAAGLATLGQPTAHVAIDVRRSITVQGDKILIQQIVFNLVRNALEAAKGEAVHVTITAAEHDDVVQVCVADSGPGIDAAVLPKVFDSFVTTKADGTGIGLSISKAIVEAHGGTMTAHNAPERGAILCFTLPQSG